MLGISYPVVRWLSVSGSGKLSERSMARECVGSKMKLVDGRIAEGTLRFLSLLSQGILSLRLSKRDCL